MSPELTLTQHSAIAIRGYQRFIEITIVTTLFLIAWGGYVHNTGSSLACPDWPTCYGKILPPMKGAIFIEHGHRLLASLVGFFCIILVVWNYLRPALQPMRALAWVALALVIVQGLWGAATVLLQLHFALSTLHLAFSQAFLAVLVVLREKTIFHRQKWIQKDHIHPSVIHPSVIHPSVMERIQRHLTLGLVLLFVQLIVGALIRHTGFATACGLGRESSVLCRDIVSNEIVLIPDYFEGIVHVFHRYLGYALVFVLVGLTLPVLRLAKSIGRHDLRRYVVAVHALVLIQVILGVMTVATLIGVGAVTFHLLGAALLWAALVTIYVRSRFIFAAV